MKRFRVGQRVQLSEEGIERGFQGRAKSKRGRIVALREYGGGILYSLKVQRDGLKTAGWYHENFWRPL